MSGSAGKVALRTRCRSCGSSAPCSPAQLALLVDLVGYGDATFFEGSGATPAPSNTTAALRHQGGCIDTDNNAADFGAAAPNPRNSVSPLNDCSIPPPALAIHDIQGAGHRSASAGTFVSGVHGIVTAKTAIGFWML
jgi:predicted extracellular nuclease